MRSKWLVTVAVGGVLVTALSWLASGPSDAQVVDKAGKPAESPLPIRQVVLFNSGVSYFQREGAVEGNSQVDLSFPISDMNDLLKSLVLQDLGGGRIRAVNYDSHDPLDRILRSFALDLNNNPTFGQILNQARGEKVEILRADTKQEAGIKQQGTIVGMETQMRPALNLGQAEVDHLNLLSEGGLRSIPLDQVFSVRFLNARLDSEFQRALRVLANAHDMQKRTVGLHFDGQGKRPVRVGYVVEHPIWKTSYRLRIEPKGRIFLQGWAIVENTGDEDWQDVRMVLVSGRPISYRMNLYEPLYVPRPIVEPELFASLRPPVHGGALEVDQDGNPRAGANQQGANQGMAGGMMGMGGMQMMGGQMIGGGMQMLGGQFSGQPGRYQQPAVAPIPMNKLTFEALQERRKARADGKADAKKAGAEIAGVNFREGIAAVSSAGEVGDHFRYSLDEKISLPRQKSAMLPIVDHTIEGSKVSIYNQAAHPHFPLLGLRVKNTSGQPLNQGPITVYEGDSYAGDSRILDLQANEERLFSYAVDQATEVKQKTTSAPGPRLNFKLGDDNLTVHYRMREVRTYTIKNRSNKERTVVLEHALRPNWQLVEPAKPREKTRDLYRFQVQVPAGETVHFDVAEEEPRADPLATAGGQPQYVSRSGIQVKTVTQLGDEQLVALKIRNGRLAPTFRQQQSKTYFVQNHSDVAREFVVDHITRADWSRLTDAAKADKGPSVFRFVLKAAEGKTASKEVVEERLRQGQESLAKEVPQSRIREYLTSDVPSTAVKTCLAKILAMMLRNAEIDRNLANEERQLKQLNDDQARVRSNLTIVPQSSDPYKKFLDRFIAQEAEIENLQKAIRELQANQQQRQRDLDALIAATTAE